MLNSQLIPANKALVMLALIETVQEIVVDENAELIEGHLYAQLMGKLSLDEFNYVIDILKESGQIKVVNHVISKG